jgi:hypothetical protein
MMTQSTTQERDAYSEIRDRGVEAQYVIPNQVTEHRKHYIVAHGTRVTDNALVFHFYPLVGENRKWLDWTPGFDLHRRLETVLPDVFDTECITCGYEQEYNSFFVIAGGYGMVPDPRGLARKLFDRVDTAFAA